MQYNWVKEFIKLNRKDIGINSIVWSELQDFTSMTDNQLKYTLLILIDAMCEKYSKEVIKNKQLQNELEIRNKALSKINGRQAQMDLVSSGEKIAYKNNASLEVVRALLKAGFSKVDIARKLNISRNTVYRRIDELKMMGVFEDEIKTIV